MIRLPTAVVTRRFPRCEIRRAPRDYNIIYKNYCKFISELNCFILHACLTLASPNSSAVDSRGFA